MKQNRRPGRLARTTIAVGCGIALALGGSVVAPAEAHAVNYCSIAHHIGSCTVTEIYQWNLMKYQKTMSFYEAVLKAMHDALRGIVAKP